MSESIIQIDMDNPVEFFGPGDIYLNRIKAIFPKLKIIVRGNLIKLIGEPLEISIFEKRMDLLLVYFDRFGKMNEKAIIQIMEQDDDAPLMQGSTALKEDVLVYGSHGKLIKPQTANQKKMVKSMAENDMIFAIGPAGTGKTYTAVALAVRALKNKEVKRIILTRPAVEAGERLGFLPGDLREKVDPYLRPVYDALDDMIPKEKLKYYMEHGVIEIAPLAYMRGRTLHKAFILLDEAQNTTPMQIKMFLTRMGPESKAIITGDTSQVDLPKNQNSGLVESINILN